MGGLPGSVGRVAGSSLGGVARFSLEGVARSLGDVMAESVVGVADPSGNTLI